MSRTVNIYECPLCHYEVESTIATPRICPSCGEKMTYVTTRTKDD